jgi:hypothetical protein
MIFGSLRVMPTAKVIPTTAEHCAAGMLRQRQIGLKAMPAHGRRVTFWRACVSEAALVRKFHVESLSRQLSSACAAGNVDTV